MTKEADRAARGRDGRDRPPGRRGRGPRQGRRGARPRGDRDRDQAPRAGDHRGRAIPGAGRREAEQLVDVGAQAGRADRLQRQVRRRAPDHDRPRRARDADEAARRHRRPARPAARPGRDLRRRRARPQGRRGREGRRRGPAPTTSEALSPASRATIRRSRTTTPSPAW